MNGFGTDVSILLSHEKCYFIFIRSVRKEDAEDNCQDPVFSGASQTVVKKEVLKYILNK